MLQGRFADLTKRFCWIAGIALGWTALATVALTEPFVGRNKHLTLYHWSGRPALLFGPVFVVFGLVWLTVFLLLLSAQRGGRWRAAVWGWLLAASPWLLVNAAGQTVPLPVWFRLPSVAFAVALSVLFVVLWRPSFAPRFERAVHVGSRGFLLFAFLGASCLIETAYLWWNARALDNTAPLHQQRMEVSHGPGPERVIWILFDELSYEQLYGHRYPGLQLPAFDALAEQSSVFSGVVPAGIQTQEVLPSLMTGQPVSDIRGTPGGALLMQTQNGAPWQLFPQHNTVFQDALNAGYSTAVTGWYNPYCRLLPAVLDRCFWTVGGLTDTGADSYASFGVNVWGALTRLTGRQVSQLVLRGFGQIPSKMGVEPKDHTRDYVLLLNSAEQMLRDPSLRFVLLHMPVPHPNGIYDRRTGQFSQYTSYLDNLALADSCMAQLRAVLEKTGQWDRTTVVLMGDHSWRVSTIWRREKPWFPEEEAASHGGTFDPRPAYVVKLAGQRSGTTIATPFAAMKTRQLLDVLMSGQVRTSEQLAAWVAAQSAPCSGSAPCRPAPPLQMAK